MENQSNPRDKKLLALLATAELTRAQLSGLTGDQLSGLTRAQLSGLTGDQLSGLTGDQLSGLTGDQLSGLTGDQEVPTVKLLYSSMFRDIQEQKRKLEQSTFGPDEVEPEAVCNTPMCIAGHTVNRAGAKGYALARAIGFAGAALLIHRASRPDVGAPRYDNYPNDWALAYIAERAREEAEGGGA